MNTSAIQRLRAELTRLLIDVSTKPQALFSSGMVQLANKFNPKATEAAEAKRK